MYNTKENIFGIDFNLGLRPLSYSMDLKAASEKIGENKLIEIKNRKRTGGLASDSSETEK
ncbi:MAG: hypothetical protein HYS24_08875 [Ignavibacteriales bacterium]|nr:hypothetical protein [Ignavibacteriales bacterium]